MGEPVRQERNIEGPDMPGRVMRAIRLKVGLSIYELASLLRYKNVETLRKIEAGQRPMSGPIQLVMEMLDNGRLDPDKELS
jgi:DNA-binding transcriptional regulator YiaG